AAINLLAAFAVIRLLTIQPVPAAPPVETVHASPEATAFAAVASSTANVTPAFSAPATAEVTTEPDLLETKVALEVALARSEARAAELQSRRLAEGARRAIQAGDLDLALSLAVSANALPSPPLEAQAVLGQLAYRPLARQAFLGHDDRI